ncbi:hypothetical protein CGRA01v4_05221 [Colletotrichum graminicola]|nr:hypothetical protein CGRA01v4_05221 [Colletotrichum graminicola]
MLYFIFCTLRILYNTVPETRWVVEVRFSRICRPMGILPPTFAESPSHPAPKNHPVSDSRANASDVSFTRCSPFTPEGRAVRSDVPTSLRIRL